MNATLKTQRRSAKRLASLVRLALLLALALQLLGAVRASSSYIDDYFLPTAKIALNKLQQSLASSASNEQAAAAARLRGAQHVAAATTTTTTSVASEPNKSDFVSLNFTWKSLEDLPAATTTPTVAPSENKPSETTTTTSARPAQPEASTAAAAELGPPPPPSSTAESVLATGAPSGEPASTQPINLPTSGEVGAPPSEQSAPTVTLGPSPSEASIRDTENEAVAAVDASIGFGSAADLFGLAGDTCYDEYGNARFCEPDFENIAFERSVEVSSECGRPASRFCTTYANEHNDQIRNCHICDAQHPKKRHPAAYLTDLNQLGAPTCWVSAPIRFEQTRGKTQNDTHSLPLSRDNVTLTLSWEKKYEITYVSLQFCSLKPDSLAVYKSQDFGSTWTAYQFYSSQCAKMYQMPVSRQRSSGRLEAICVNSTGGSQAGAASGAQSRIAFSTLDSSAPSSNELVVEAQIERSAQLQDWITATNLRIVLDQHQASWIQASLAQHHQASGVTSRQNSLAKQTKFADNLANNQTAQLNGTNGANNQQAQSTASESTIVEELTPLEASLSNPSDSYNYALADLTVGGRCKCNGHASRCVHGDDGRLQCDCRHNTAGRDCERCAPFHFDRPWQRATQLDANPCQPCQCNGHSRKCRFDSELYQLSGKRSGGVCINCRDNTAGRHCHYCKEGFTRDHSKPMNDKEACKPCDCHPVGSLGRVCNQTSGQCPCKEGVTGLECNRCAPGYQQSSSPSEPCIKLPENDINYEPTIEAVAEDQAAAVAASNEPSASGVIQQDSDDNARGDPSIEAKRSAPTAASARRQPPSLSAQDSDAAQEGPYYQQPGGANQELEAGGGGDRLVPMLVNSYAANGGRHRATGARPNAGQWHQASGRARHFYPATRQRFEPAAGDELGLTSDGIETTSGDENDDDDAGAQQNYAARQHQLYGHAANVYYQGGGRRLGSRHHQLEADDDDYLARLGPMVSSMSYAAPPMDTSDQEQANNFNNHIQAPAQTSAAGGQRAFWHQAGANQYRGRHFQQQQQQQQVSAARRRIEQHLAANSLACADCQPTTRRLSFRQFCQLEYAIKAQVLSKSRAADWTQYEVEILDVFRSPGALSSVVAEGQHFALHHSGGQKILSNKANFVDNSLTMQADDPAALQLAQMAPNNTTKPANGLVHTVHTVEQIVLPTNRPSAMDSLSPVHRLKIGSVQKIWVPTEDVACKCPKIKLRATYLLMGLVDSKENSGTLIQLDRHGVALEWKSSLQERLIKYQRRHSRNKC